MPALYKAQQELIRIAAEVRRQELRSKWRLIWTNALGHMPWKAKGNAHDKLKALRDCLGWTEARTRRAYVEARIPKKPDEQLLLQQLAGNYGTQIAALRLAASGKIKLYPNWPGVPPKNRTSKRPRRIAP